MQTATSKIDTVKHPIVPPANSTVLYFGTAIVGDHLELTYNDGKTKEQGDLVSLQYTPAWSPTDTTLVVQLPAGWVVVPKDSNLAWSSVGSIWVAQLLAPVISYVLANPPLELISRFSIAEPATGKSHDPVVVVTKEG